MGLLDVLLRRNSDTTELRDALAEVSGLDRPSIELLVRRFNALAAYRRNLARMAEAVQELLPAIDRTKASVIARFIANRSGAMRQRQHQLAAGIRRAKWQASGAGCLPPRPCCIARAARPASGA